MSVLEKKDHTHTNPKVRLAALEKLDDPEVVVEVACHDESPRVRLTAVSRLTDDLHLEKVARNAESLDVRLVAIERIFSQGIIADLLKVPEDVELIGMCFSRITDRRIIESIAQDPDYSPTVRRMAVEYFADESYLSDAAAASEEKPQRKTEEAVAAADRNPLARRAVDRSDPAGAWRRHLDHRLVGLHREQRLSGDDVVAGADVPGDDLGIDETLAKVGQVEHGCHQRYAMARRAAAAMCAASGR